MKKGMKIISLLLVVCVVLGMGSMVSATSNNECTQFDYVIYDKYGNVTEQGTTPDFRTRYSWGGITLANGGSVKLRPAGADYFEIPGNANTSFEYTLDRHASMSYSIMKSTGGAYQSVKNETSTSIAARFTYTTSGYGIYFISLTNFSSDSVTINNASWTWS